MDRRPLGRSGLHVTSIGLGLAALGRPGYINLGHHEDLEDDYDMDAMASRAHTVLDAAWDAGVRYFDAARSYGRAEAFLGSWLDSRRHQDLTVSSKWGYMYTADWKVQSDAHEIKEHSLPVLDRQIQESRAILGEHLQLYQIHSATLESGVLENTTVLTRLAELKSSGMRIGLSVSGPRQADVIRRATSLMIDERRLFDTCQATWNLLETSAGSALEEAHCAGLGIIIKEGLANGRLTTRNTCPDFANAQSTLAAIAKQHQTSIDAVALAAVLAQPWVDTVLSGAAHVDHLQSNVAANKLTLDDATTVTLASLTEPPEDYWNTRSSLAWN